MRVLVTGAGGFAGGHIARRLAEAGHEVAALTRRSTVAPPASATAARRFRVVEAAIEGGDLPRDIDAVVHAAATSIWAGISVDRMITDNVLATQALVRHALAMRARAFVFYSSVSVFGTVRVPVLTEAEPPLDPDAYGATKLLGEQMLADVSGALPSLSIRLPAVIGRGSKRNWPSECLRKLKSGEPLAAFNPEAPFNNLVHEADLAALVAAALGRGVSGATVGLAGSSGRTTVGEVVRLLAGRLGSPSVVTWSTRDRPAFLLDGSLLSNRFGVTPMPVETALERFVTDNAD